MESESKFTHTELEPPEIGTAEFNDLIVQEQNRREGTTVAYARVLVWQKLQNTNPTMSESVQAEMESIRVYVESIRQKYEEAGGMDDSIDEEERRTAVIRTAERMVPGLKAAKLFYRTIGFQPRESDAGPLDYERMQHTSFQVDYPSFLAVQLLNILNEQQWSEFVDLSTEAGVNSFIESQPLKGMRVAEIGGDQSSVLMRLGAEVDNSTTLVTEDMSESELARLHAINLDNWQQVYTGDYDMVCSHMVMDTGTNIEQMRPEYTTTGDQVRGIEYACMELHEVCNAMLKSGGLAIHVTGDAGIGLSENIRFSKNILQIEKTLFADKIDRSWGSCDQAAEVSNLLYFGQRNRAETDMVQTPFLGWTGLYRNLLGFEPVITTLDWRDRPHNRDEAPIFAGELSVLRKIQEPRYGAQDLARFARVPRDILVR
ncbi:MAG: hypothetical protein Q7S64_02825 [bacterium]|nr:hypothetical protein [bacterium]